MKVKYLQVGKIVGVHGIKGLIKVQHWCDTPADLCRYKRLYLAEDKPIAVERAVPHGNMVLLKLKGIDTPQQAQALRGIVLRLSREDAVLPEGRYFIEELIGCQVTDADTGLVLGTVQDVSATGANDVWHIEKDGRTYLLPAIDECIVSVDVEKGSAVVRPLKGIFDDED